MEPVSIVAGVGLGMIAMAAPAVVMWKMISIRDKRIKGLEGISKALELSVARTAELQTEISRRSAENKGHEITIAALKKSLWK